jgi:hypothetical protein
MLSLKEQIQNLKTILLNQKNLSLSLSLSLSGKQANFK